jgi:DNA-binding CsgD family transcriptional regulator
MAFPVIEDFAQSVTACVSASAVGELLRKEIARRGYTSSSCGIVVLPDSSQVRSEEAPCRFLFQNWSKEWRTARSQIGFPTKRFAAAESSMIVGEGRRRLTPFAWSDVARERGLARIEADVCDALLACGWRDGLLVPVHGPSGYYAMVAMASPERDLDLSAGARAYLRMIAILAHERAIALSYFGGADLPTEPLTARERECMRWVADGKTDREIGKILGVSATTVKFFVNGARAKFCARTRAQAVARFVLSGLF